MTESRRVGVQDLTVAQAHAVVDLLEPLLTPRRRERIHEVLARRTRHLALLLEEVFSDHNTAAIMRTADAMGLLDVHHISTSEKLYMSKRVALGSEKWLLLRQHASLEAALAAARAEGRQVWGAAVHGAAVPVDELPVERPLALVFGNEHAGLSPDAIERLDGCFHIPMLGFAESYNVSVAAALTMDRVLARAPRHGLGVEERLKITAGYYAQSVRASGALLERRGLPLPVLSWVEPHWTETE